MKKNIPVKIGWELLTIILIVLAFPIVGAVKGINSESFGENKDSVFGFIIPVLALGFVLFLFFTIKYSIDSDTLYIKNSIFGTTKIKVSEIRKIEKTWNLISSPAPSLSGRVEIYYNNNSVVISPKNFEDFKNDLLKINPNIEVKE